MLLNTGDKLINSTYETGICYKIGSQINYSLENTNNAAGDAYNWAVSVGLVKEFREIEQEALLVPDSNEVYFVPKSENLRTVSPSKNEE